MGHPFRVSIPHTSRSLLYLRWRLAVILFIAVLLHQHHLFSVSRQSLAAKYSPTKFYDAPNALPVRLDEEFEVQDELTFKREAWRVLGEGWEGKVFAYNDSVIKTFTPGRSPFRNCAPGSTGEKWPTEIAASLRFGGSYTNIGGDGGSNTTLEGFLPVKAYFKTSVSPSKPPEWHLVTPLLSGGNLNTLAKSLTTDQKPHTFREVDFRYRPVFNTLLSNLHRLHTIGYCHDDIKPANIFIQDSTHWVLGDLGNVRHITHPYHSSRLWSDNQQLPDCRANDAVRALKSYVKFVQMSASDGEELNEEFFKRREPLSRLFWTSAARAHDLSAARIVELSRAEHPTSEVGDHVFGPTRSFSVLELFSKRLVLQRAVDRAIQTRMGEKLARWWGMVYVFGIPSVSVCSV
ncbi:hypothetical protein CC86DRAFT_147673 [Ophiobolus disseminans]|uniref:Protein kinase domain-containing protein n=1 Tax=Ophiobolus disseminans TaxID=1469910 RepID=A0A6A6ZDI9_9PLEO|nr:hypothetical protein CC86DRAFT_147673 [Ophiobolus disseminans]